MDKKMKKILAASAALILALALVAGSAEIIEIAGGSASVAAAISSGGDGDSGDSGSGGGGSYKPAAKKSNPIKASGKKYNINYKKLAKKKQVISRKKLISVSNAKGSVTYKKKSGNKKITVSKKGKFTLKKGLKAGTYKVKVKVRAAGNSSYKSKTKTVTVKIKVGKAENSLRASGKSVTLSGDKLAAGNQVVKRASTLNVSGAKGTVSYKMTCDNSGFSMNSKTGDITVAKGTPAGTYTLCVKIAAAGNSNYAKKTVSANVKVVITAESAPADTGSDAVESSAVA